MVENKQDSIEETEFEQNITPRSRQQQIDHEKQKQEGQLDEIYAGVKRQKKHVQGVNNEISEQNVIIDNLDQNVTQASTDLQAQTNAAAEINKKKKKICMYYVVIVILIIILVVILAI